MQCSGLQVAAFLLLLGGTILVVISIGTSNWTQRSSGGGVLGTAIGAEFTYERGLWQECYYSGVGKLDSEKLKATNQHCINRYEDVFKEREKLGVDGDSVKERFKKLEAWEIAVMALMIGSGLLGILSLVFSPCCCNRCGCCLATFVFFAASLCASAICTYAYYTSTNEEWKNDVKQFGWSFWCAVGGAACQFISGILFAVSRCRQHSYSHTI